MPITHIVYIVCYLDVSLDLDNISYFPFLLHLFLVLKTKLSFQSTLLVLVFDYQVQSIIYNFLLIRVREKRI